MAYKVNWDNGSNACGTFPNEFDTEEAAQEFADNWMSEMNAADELDPENDEESYFAEVVPSELETDMLSLPLGSSTDCLTSEQILEMATNPTIRYAHLDTCLICGWIFRDYMTHFPPAPK